jgi:hypothetical protein
MWGRDENLSPNSQEEKVVKNVSLRDYEYIETGYREKEM